MFSYLILHFPNDKFWTLTVWKSLHSNNRKFDENGRKLSKRIDNTIGKGEIANNEQFLLFPLWFKKTWTADT